MAQWYKNVYRRNLVDMHINDIDETYLSLFSAEEYFAYLKKANIQSPMIYLQSHVGLCNFPTKVSKTHNYFLKNPDEIKKLIALCKKDGMKVVGYYSLIFNNEAVNCHPDWEMKNADKSSWRDHGQRYGLCCPNNEQYREFLKENIAELASFYPGLDGIFYDMPYWEVTCHCHSCEEKWHKMYEEKMPEKEDWNNASWLNYVLARQKWMGEFTSFVRQLSLKIMPHTTVEFNFAAVIGCNWMAGSTELINDECEFTGGDLYGDLYNHSFAAKYYYAITKHQPFEYMTCRCNKNLREHTINKNEISLESEIMLTAMHHGASLIIDAINPDGSLDLRVANRLGNVFKKQLPYEKYMDKGSLYSEVGIIFDSRTQFANHGLASNKECAIRVSKTLIENHIPYSIIANSTFSNLDKYQLIIASSLNDIGNENFIKLIDYVKGGGVLYLSGYSDPLLLKTFFAGEIYSSTFANSPYKHVYKGYDECQCYIYPSDKEYETIFDEFDEKYPLPITYKLPLFKFEKGDIKAKINLPYTDPDNNKIFASIHSNPPGMASELPAICEVNYGKGKVIYSSALLENDERYNFKQLFMRLIGRYIKSLLNVKCSSYVEMITFKDKDDLYINFFDLNFANDIVNRKVELNLPKGYSHIYLLPDKNEIIKKDNKFTHTFTKYLSILLTK